MTTKELQSHPAIIPSEGKNFLDLPVELRLMIFRYVLRTPTGDDILVLRPYGSAGRMELHFAAVEPARGKGTEWELGTYHITHAQMTWSFMICRALYDEQMKLFYCENTFVFGGFRDMATFLRRISSIRRMYIGSVTVCDDTYYGDLHSRDKSRKKSKDPLITVKAAREAWKLLGQSKYLRRLEIRFEEYVNIAFPAISAHGQEFERIEGSSGKIGTDRMKEVPHWKWHYTDIEEFCTLPGFHVVKNFRGLKEVVVVERRTLSPLRAENDELVAEFRAMLTSGKKLQPLIKEDQVPALVSPQRKDITSAKVMKRYKQRLEEIRRTGSCQKSEDSSQRFKQAQEMGIVEKVKRAQKLEYPIALWEERMYSPRKGRALYGSFFEVIASIKEDEKHRDSVVPSRKQAAYSWIVRFLDATDFRRYHKPLVSCGLSVDG